MNLPKAIEIKELYYKGGEMPSASDYREADRISIEAMKRIQTARKWKATPWNSPLPGETKD